MKKNMLIGIDIGGTNIKGIVTQTDGEIIAERIAPTGDIPGQDNSAVWKSNVRKMISELEVDAGNKVDYVGISSPGTANKDNDGILSNGTKMLGIEGFIWSDYLDKKAYVLNDAHAALYAESRIGAGQGYKDILMVTLGTGVGGGIMVGGKLLQGSVGRAGHIGHMSVNQDVRMGIANTPGSLENAVAEVTIKHRSYGRFESTKDVLEGYMAGDTWATWIWLNAVQSLSRGIISLINVISPQIIIIGGGISKAGIHLLDPLKEFMDVYEWRPGGFSTPLVFARLSNNAGAIGAALFAADQHNKV